MSRNGSTFGHGGGGGGHGGGGHGGGGHGWHGGGGPPGPHYWGGLGGGWGGGGWGYWGPYDLYDDDLDDGLPYRLYPRRRWAPYSTFEGGGEAGAAGVGGGRLWPLVTRVDKGRAPIPDPGPCRNCGSSSGGWTKDNNRTCGACGKPYFQAVGRPHSRALESLTGYSPGGCPQRRLAALDELRTKSLSAIQQETAFTWAYRAAAAHSVTVEAQARGQHDLAHRWMHDATEYAHEALEHAALCGDDRVLLAVRRIVRGAI